MAEIQQGPVRQAPEPGEDAPRLGSFPSNKVVPATTSPSDDPEGGQAKAPATGLDMRNAHLGRKSATKAKLEKFMSEFDRNKDGNIDIDELVDVVENLASERKNRKMLFGMIIGMGIFGLLLIGALAGITWGMVSALKEEEIRGGVMYDIDVPGQVVQTANSDMVVVGGVLVNRLAYQMATNSTDATALPGSNSTPHASTVLRTAAFVGTQQKFNSQVSVKALMELKYLYIQGAGQVELALSVLGVARVPMPGSAHGTVVHILTLAGTITLDGTAIDFNESLAPIFVQAGFAVSSNRRSLIGMYDILGFFNFIEDSDAFNMPTGEPMPALPKGSFRMQIQIFEPCAIPANNFTDDRCVYVPPSTSAPPAPPPSNWYSPPPYYDSSANTTRRQLHSSASRRRLQTTTTTTTGDGIDLAGTTIINGTRYMVHTETATYWNGIVRTVYEYALFPGFVRVELANNASGTMQSWTQEVPTDGEAPASYFCTVKPFNASSNSFSNLNESLVNFTFVGYEEYMGRSARHFMLVVNQPDQTMVNFTADLPPLPKALTVDYWDSRSGGAPLGFEIFHPWLGRMMINVTEFTPLADSDVDPKDFIYPLADNSAGTCTNSTSVPKLYSPFNVPSYYSTGPGSIGNATSRRRSLRKSVGGNSAFKSPSRARSSSVAKSSSVASRSSSVVNPTSKAGLQTTVLVTQEMMKSVPGRQLVDNSSLVPFGSRHLLDSSIQWLNQVPPELLCGAGSAYMFAYNAEPCTVSIAMTGPYWLYPYIQLKCGGSVEELPIFFDGSISIDICPSNLVIQGCIAIEVGLNGYLEESETKGGIGFMASIAGGIHLPDLLNAELCVGWDITDGYGYLKGDLTIALLVIKGEMDVEMDFNGNRIWMDGLTFSAYVGIDAIFFSYWSEIGSITFFQDATIWEASSDPSTPPVYPIPPSPAQGKSYTQKMIGCYTDSSNRVMTQILVQDGMTVNQCRAAAIAAGYRYYSIEVARECYATNTMATAISLGQSTNCNMKCADGNLCGGGWAVSVYDSGYLGCFNDNSTRMLPTLLRRDSSGMSVDVCRQLALQAGVSYFGLQGSQECWASNDITRALSLGASTGCNQKCTGSSDMCGGAWANSLFSTVPDDGTKAMYSNASPNAWVGCYKDVAGTPVMTLVATNSSGMKVSVCRKTAVSFGFRFFAIQNQTMCFGSNNLTQATSAGASTSCSNSCTAESNTVYQYTGACGGSLANAIQDSGYIGCFVDSATRRFSKLLIRDTSALTIDSCRALAVSGGYDLYGIEVGNECYGGYYSQLSTVMQLGPSYSCTNTCTGSSDFLCGGPWALSVFQVVKSATTSG